MPSQSYVDVLAPRIPWPPRALTTWSGGRFVCTVSNRLFATKAIRGWLYSTDEQRCDIVAEYVRPSAHFEEPGIARRTPAANQGDPVFAVGAATIPLPRPR
jgi:hypothetical protein